MSYEFSSGVRLQVGQIIQDPVGSFEYVVEEVLESGANAFAAKAERRKKAFDGGESSGRVFLKKYKSPGGASSWFDGFVDYQQEIRRRLQDHPGARSGMVEILKFFQRSLGGDSRRRAYYQLFSWEGQANNLRHYLKKESGFSEQKKAAERFQLACDFLAGLAAIHHAGVIHSDLKPENLMLNPDSRGIWKLKFVDFDFSLIKNKEAPWINPQRQEDKMGYLGTERYLSPEHLKGQRPSEASDVFTAGIILSELLTGRHPVGEDKEMYNRRILGGQFGKVRLADSIRSVVDDPDELDKAINRMLSFETGDRPSALEISDLFETKRKYSIVPTDSPESRIASETERELEEAGEEILNKLGSSGHASPLVGSVEHKPDIYAGREREDKRDFRKILLFLVMVIGLPLLIWKFMAPAGPTAANVTSNNQRESAQQSPQERPFKEKVQENGVATSQSSAGARMEDSGLVRDQKPVFLSHKIALGAKRKVRFNLTGYQIGDGTITRLNLNINHKANGQDILPDQIWPENGFTVTEFRLWSPLMERILIWWNGQWFDPLGQNSGSDREGFFGSMTNGQLGPNPCIRDMEVFHPDNLRPDVFVSYKGVPLKNFNEEPPLKNQEFSARYFGESFMLKYPLSAASQISVRFNNDTEDEGQKLTLARLAELKDNDVDGQYNFVELKPNPDS